MSEQPARYQRSASGMIGAMIILLVIIGVFVGFRRLTSSEPSSAVQTVGYHQDAKFARQAVHYTLLAPPRLPAGWRATTVQYTSGPTEHWHLGVLTNQNRYVGLEQALEPESSMVHTYVDNGAAKKGTVRIAGHTWTTYTDSIGDFAVARQDGKAATLVVGHQVPQPTLERYVASLR
ncbi:MAG: DUF4245 domain-containing protein [Actinomycetes bacterium]